MFPLSTKLQGNTLVRVFKELQYFTKITAMPNISNARFTVVYISQQITSVPAYSFWYSRQLETLVVYANSRLSINGNGNNGFTNTLISIYVPDDDVSYYKGLSAWSAVKNRIFPLSQYVE